MEVKWNNLMKKVGAGSRTTASTNPLVPLLAPSLGGVMMQIWAPLALVQAPVVQVPVTPFAVAALQPWVTAEEVEALYL